MFRKEEVNTDFSPTVPLDLDLGTKSDDVRREILTSRSEALWIAPRLRKAFGSETLFSLRSGRTRVELTAGLEKSFEGGLELWTQRVKNRT